MFSVLIFSWKTLTPKGWLSPKQGTIKVLFQAVWCCCNVLSSGVAVSFDTAVPSARFKDKSASVNNRFSIASFYIPHSNRSLDTAFKLSPNWQFTSNFLNPPNPYLEIVSFSLFFNCIFQEHKCIAITSAFMERGFGKTSTTLASISPTGLTEAASLWFPL